MKSKVMMFDASGAQIGETFMRRARQLVNQQRAEWINDGAIRFAADEEMDEILADELPESASSKDTGPEALLYYLAEKRIQERRMFILHSALMLPGFLVLAILSEMMTRNQAAQFLLATSWGWVTPYFVHAFIFIGRRIKEHRPNPRVFERELNKVRRLYK